jgi:hypothetical protein
LVDGNKGVKNMSLTSEINRLARQEQRQLDGVLAKDRRVREAVGPRPVRIAVLVRRDLWDAQKDTIRQELSKLGAVAVFDEPDDDSPK